MATNNYLFLDGDASLLSARSSVISGTTIHEPYVTIDSVLLSLPVTFANSPSISGAVTIVGNPSISGTVLIGNNASVSGLVGSSIIGIGHRNTADGDSAQIGLVTASNSRVFNGVSWDRMRGDTVGVYIVPQGSILATVQYAPSIYGNISGSVLSQQLGTRISSIVNSIPSSLLTGIHGHRNDALASYLGADLSWRPIATDSAGRTLIRPFAPEESRIEGYVALTSTSLTTLVAAGGAGIRNYVTDLWFANTGATTTLVTLSDSAGSILGYTIAPTGSGSNLPGLTTPIRTGTNASFNIQAGSNTSTLYATVKGFRAP